MNSSNRELTSTPISLIFKMVEDIEKPLSTLMDEISKVNSIQEAEIAGDNSKEVMFSNTLQIKGLIDDVLLKIKLNQEEPTIFGIYQSNQYVKSACNELIEPSKISKEDIAWLLALEKEVYKNIDRREISLADLSYSLAVSKRQLNRKVHNLIHLTPNKYIRILKLHRAKQLVDDFRYDTVSQISYAVGYSDTHYFSKLFFSQYNISPKDLLDSKR